MRGLAVVPMSPDRSDPGRFFDAGGLVVQRLAEEIQQRGHVQVGGDGRLYRYCEGVFRADGETFVRAQVRKLLGDRFKRRHVDEVLAWLRADFATVPERPSDSIINVANGLLDWRGGYLSEHTHEVPATIQLPVRWVPEATCPQIDAFLAAVLPEDAFDFIVEVIGYAIYTGNPFRIAILLLGPGRNGKTTLLLVLRALLGPANVSAIPLQALSENRFAAAELFGRLANVCGDLDARAIKHTDTFKMLTGGDPMLAERKHQTPFTFTPYALPIFSANEPPISSDQTEAWFDRWLVIPMDRRLAESEIDPELPMKLTTPAELEGLMVRAVDGLRRLMARGRFDPPEFVRRGRDDYRERLDTVAAFMGEGVGFNPTVWTPRSELYAAYRQWCTGSGRLPVSAQSFHARLRDLVDGRAEERKREGVRGYAGLWLVSGGGA